MLSAEQAFLDTIDDLRARSGFRGSEYDAVQAAGLLRRLLFDDQPLLTQVNCTYREDVEFVWYPAYMTDGTHFIVDFITDAPVTEVLLKGAIAIDAAGELVPHEPEPPDRGKYHAFLRLPAVRRVDEEGAGPTRVTLQELLSHYANRMGGVHYDPRPPDNTLLGEALARSEAYLRVAVATAARITIRALEPLAARVYHEDLRAVQRAAAAGEKPPATKVARG